MTVLEMSVVIAVLLLLLVVSMIGANAWRRGVDRASAALNIRNVQTATRAYQNLYGYSPGTIPYAENGTQSIADHLLAKGYITDQLHATITTGEDYEIPREDVFPAEGELYVRSLIPGVQERLLARGADW